MSLDSKEERKPWLEGSEDGWTDDERVYRQELASRQDGCNKKTHRYLFGIQLALLACNIGLLLVNFFSLHRNGGVSDSIDTFKHPYSPAYDGVEYIAQSIDTHDENDLFTGKPRKELDAAWSHLLRSTTIRVSADELRTLNQSSLSLSDGSGYIGYVESFHMLHCLKRVYQFQYPDYYSDLRDSGKLTIEHWDHCLQVLRKGIMCNADPTMNTFTRDYSKPYNVSVITSGPRKCVNWDHFESWAFGRALGTDIHALMNSGGVGEAGPPEVLTPDIVI